MRLVAKASTVEKIVKKDVPLELEDIGLPMNTFKNKAPFTGKIVSVERIVGPKATGETCHIIIETNKEIPFVEGQSYGVIPPVSRLVHLVVKGPQGCRRRRMIVRVPLLPSRFRG